ncbi:ferritin-like domain-containing protein [Microvirga brassicacearum]|uniref:Rubrerythrin family protein n=1 Tax=Microvirga brassicacearum TaxID=2580413 RepID=A0A5N3PAV7_9HYPH|nr:ferritin family protein [Microvirga brassicacearum]KAB0266833.1 rubrerythrin family protein [Microvirga brassicacearum]
MSLLKTEPAHAVTSLEELFAIAHSLELEAATRYEELALRMRSAGDVSLAETFERLASEERGHLNNVVRWSETEKGRGPDAAHLSWTLPETFDDEGAKVAAPEIQTPYGALSMAVRNEERAFAFWSYVAANTEKPEIKQAAEKMAHEELEHISTLRHERRRAYHAERAQTPPATGHKVADAAALETRLAALLDSLVSDSGESERAKISEFAVEARRTADELARTPLSLAALPAAAPTIENPIVLAEVLVEGYLNAADHFQDEAGLTLTQALASRAINRLAWLRAHLQIKRD